MTEGEYYRCQACSGEDFVCETRTFTVRCGDCGLEVEVDEAKLKEVLLSMTSIPLFSHKIPETEEPC